MTAKSHRVLLTGGAGFIGSHVAEALLRRGAQLTIVDNLDEFYSPLWKKANLEEIARVGDYKFFAADICEIEALRQVMARTQPELVIHLAARPGVRPSIANPSLYERVNVAGTLNLLELCREFQVGKFIFGSSSSVYGASKRLPFSEDESAPRPISPYGATKLAGELLAHTYAHLYSLPVICLRFFTVYGPRQRPDLAIHKFTALMEAAQPLPIFGDGSTGRDYTFIDDIVAGVMAAVDYELPSSSRTPFEVINLGSCHPVKLAELVEQLEQAVGRKAIREPKPLQPGDLPVTWADTTKANRLLGYRPITPLEEGLKKFVGWYRTRSPHRRA